MSIKLDHVKSVGNLADCLQHKTHARNLPSHDPVANSSRPFVLVNLKSQSHKASNTSKKPTLQCVSEETQTHDDPDPESATNNNNIMQSPMAKKETHIWDSSRIKSLLSYSFLNEEKEIAEATDLSDGGLSSQERKNTQTSTNFRIGDESNVMWHPHLQIAYNYFNENGVHNKKLEDASRQKMMNKQTRNLAYNHHHWKSSVFEGSESRDESNDPRLNSCVNSWSIVRNPITGLQVKYDRLK